MPEPAELDAIRAFPKISLHDHLDGGLRPTTVIELAAARGIALPNDDPDALAAWVVAECDGSLDQYLRVSDLLVELLAGDPDALFRMGREFALDLAQDGVVYAEVRWAPEEMATRGLTAGGALAAVTSGLRAGVAEVEANGGILRIEQILCAIRTQDRSVEIAELALSHRNAGVVGFDLAGAEAGHPPRAHKPALDLLTREGMPVTLHAGEADGVDSIRAAIDDGRAARIGHGVRLVEDIDGNILGPVARAVRNAGIALEVCPSSNLQTGASPRPLSQHPFDRLQQLRFAVTVSPDNRLLSGTTVTAELAALASTFGYDLSDIARFQLMAAGAAFLPADQRLALRQKIHTAFHLASASPVEN